MSGTFVSASSQYLSANSGLGFGSNAVPMTVSCWYKHGSNGTRPLFSLGTAGSNNNRNTLRVATASLVCETNATTTPGSSTISGVVTGWNHCVGTWATGASRKAYLNGTAASSNTTSRNMGVPAAIAIGAAPDLSAYLDGDIAELAVWNVVLTDAEITALSKGVSPRLIRPSALVFYAPLRRELTSDLRGGVTLTNNGTVTVGNHPAVFTPSSARTGVHATFSAGTISVTVDGSPVSDGDVITFDDSTTASPPADISVVISSPSGAITVTKVAIPSWGNRLRVSAGAPTSVSIGVGGTANVSIALTPISSSETLTFIFDTMGSAHPTHERGCCYGYLNITWNNGGSDQTFRLVFRGAMSDATVPLSYDATSFLDVVISGWSLGSNTVTGANPLGFSWGIKDTGHLVFAQTYIAPQIAAGVRDFFFHQVIGQMFLLLTPPENDICPDSFTHAAELGINTLWYTTWDDMIEYLESENPTGRNYCYNGTWRQDQDYIDLRAAGDAFGFLQRFWGEISNYLKHPSVYYCGDVPAWAGATGNPEVTTGEMRYACQLALTNILDLNDRGEMMTEPRGLDADTQWFASAGFGRCVVDATFRRNHPARYTDASTATTNAHMAGRSILRWHITLDAATLAHQIADSLGAWDAAADDTKVIVGLYDYINVGGGTFEDLRGEVNAVLAKLGSASP